MFTLDGLSCIRKVKWKQLRPGSIVLGGIVINGSPIPELMDFPVLTEDIIYNLLKKYRLLEHKEVLIADALYNFNPYDLAGQMSDQKKSLNNFNKLRDDFNTQKTMILKDLGLEPDLDIPIINSEYVDRDYLRKDTYNSFTYMYGLDLDLEELPSMFHRPDLKLSISDLLTNRVNEKFNIPDDKEVNLHLVVDFSKSMDYGNKLELAITAVNSLYDFIIKNFKNCAINLYVFSDTCIPVVYPMNDIHFKRGDTSFSSFMKKVLHKRDRNVYNSIILITDGLPTDKEETLKIAELIKQNRIDYTQIILQMREEQRFEVKYPTDSKVKITDNIIQEITSDMVDLDLTDEQLDSKMKKMYEDFTNIANICGGNQIILKINEFIKIVTVECYDRYLGALTLATKKDETISEVIPGRMEIKDRIKKWNFPSI